MIRIQHLPGWRGVRIMTRGKHRLFLRMVFGMGMEVIQGVMSVLLAVSVLVKACR
jgi:hypothetical protein